MKRIHVIFMALLLVFILGCEQAQSSSFEKSQSKEAVSYETASTGSSTERATPSPAITMPEAVDIEKASEPNFYEMLMKHYKEKAKEDEKRLKALVGTWEITEIEFTPRNSFPFDYPSEYDGVGKIVEINEDLGVELMNRKYICNGFKTVTCDDIARRKNSIYAQVESMGEDVIEINYIGKSGKGAMFSLYVNDYGYLFIYGGEGQFTELGMYRLERVE